MLGSEMLRWFAYAKHSLLLLFPIPSIPYPIYSLLLLVLFALTKLIRL